MAEAKDGSDSAQPLDEAWWEEIEVERPPAEEVPLLAPYEKTRPGFELLVAAGCPGCAEFFEEVGDGHVQVCLWDIWEREKDPADSDEAKRRINEMQSALGGVSDEDRCLRLQIASLQRCYWEFPSNVDLILGGIGSGRVNLDAGVSCEPAWVCVLWVLRHRRGYPAPDALLAERQRLSRAYMTMLTWWMFNGDLKCLQRELPQHAELAERIYRHLGRPTKLKALYAEEVRAAIGWQAFPGTRADREICGSIMEACDTAIAQELGGKEDVVGAKIEPKDLCHHAFFRHIDHQLANIGAGRVVPLPGAGEERKRIVGAVTNYVHVLGSWLAGRTREEVASIWPPCAETAARVYDVLGAATPRKRWLVACLWKHLQDNQADHGRGPLDEQPERFAIPLDALAI